MLYEVITGTSEVEHVLATQTLIQKKSKNMKVEITGKLRPGVTAKDITLAVIGHTGTAGGTGYVIEYNINSHHMVRVVEISPIKIEMIFSYNFV